METYRKAKEKFFDPFYIVHAIVNADDEAGKHMLGRVPATTFGVSMPADATPTTSRSTKAASATS